MLSSRPSQCSCGMDTTQVLGCAPLCPRALWHLAGVVAMAFPFHIDSLGQEKHSNDGLIIVLITWEIPWSFKYLFFLIDYRKEMAKAKRFPLSAFLYWKLPVGLCFGLFLLRELANKKEICMVGAVGQCSLWCRDPPTWEIPGHNTNIKHRGCSKSPAIFANTMESTENSNESLKIQTYPLN